MAPAADFYNANQYRITKTANPVTDTVVYDPPRLSPLAQLQQQLLPREVPTPFADLTAGEPVVLDRGQVLERLKPIAGGDKRRLEWLLLAEWLEVEVPGEMGWHSPTLSSRPSVDIEQETLRQPLGRGRLAALTPTQFQDDYEDEVAQMRKVGRFKRPIQEQMAERYDVELSTFKRWLRESKVTWPPKLGQARPAQP